MVSKRSTGGKGPLSASNARQAAARESLRKVMREGDAAGVLDAVLDRGRDAVFVVDPDRNILLFNRRAEEVTGFSREEVEGRHCLAGFRCASCLERCRIFERGQIDGAELELFRKDGSTVRVEKSGQSVDGWS